LKYFEDPSNAGCPQSVAVGVAVGVLVGVAVGADFVNMLLYTMFSSIILYINNCFFLKTLTPKI